MNAKAARYKYLLDNRDLQIEKLKKDLEKFSTIENTDNSFSNIKIIEQNNSKKPKEKASENVENRRFWHIVQKRKFFLGKTIKYEN